MAFSASSLADGAGGTVSALGALRGGRAGASAFVPSAMVSPPSGGQKETSTGAGSIAAMSASSSPATFLVKLVNSSALRKPMSWEALG